ncbi:MAG: hypothetical protein U1E65_13435 [Myxococcota bacterium]
MKRLLWLGLLVACQDLPPVDGHDYACTAEVFDDGSFQCLPSDYCAQNACVPRLNCQTEGQAGCRAESTRCELSATPERAAVSCQPGVHTTTSTPVLLAGECPCQDGLLCTALATLSVSVPDAHAYPLFVIPSTTRPATLPQGPLGISGEVGRARTCARPCASEVDCPAAHTCRAATVLAPAALGGADLGRHTIGVCFPDLLTVTTTAAEQPDPGLCRTKGDCTSAAGRFDGFCQANVEVVPDHPTDPGAEGWGEHRALLTRCVSDPGPGAVDGHGCLSSGECRSGACYRGHCVPPCDPVHNALCPGACLDSVIERKLPSGASVSDHLYVCQY